MDGVPDAPQGQSFREPAGPAKVKLSSGTQHSTTSQSRNGSKRKAYAARTCDKVPPTDDGRPTRKGDRLSRDCSVKTIVLSKETSRPPYGNIPGALNITLRVFKPGRLFTWETHLPLFVGSAKKAAKVIRFVSGIHQTETDHRGTGSG
jgi:hypothetical protein